MAGRLHRDLRWEIGATLVALILSLPMLVVAWSVFDPAVEVWNHLAATVLPRYLRNTLLLLLGVGAGTLMLGVPCAWLCALYRFPGSSVLRWALLLPMAVPAYIIAYTYTGMLDVAGPVQTALRDWFDLAWGEYWFPRIRSLGGAAAMLSLVLYPYVYLLSLAAFLERSPGLLESSRLLGRGPWRTFFTVAMPLARPAVVAGLSLALMETLADFGTMQYFGVDTFTTGIFRTWFGLGDLAAASQLAVLLMVSVLTLAFLERFSRRRARYHSSGAAPGEAQTLHGRRALAATIVCTIPVLLGFALPAFQLGIWLLRTWRTELDRDFLLLLGNSLLLAASVALVTLIVALIPAYGQRLRPGALLRVAARTAAIGYTVPGLVVAIGVIVPFAWLDNTLDGWMRRMFDTSTGLVLSGTLAALLFACMVRFMAIALQTVSAGLERITPTMDQAARSLGLGPMQVLGRVHLPMLRGSMLTALLLVFVETLKELPATLVLRPFNFSTLAVRAYELASDEFLPQASGASLAIVCAGIVPVILISRDLGRQARQRP